MHKRKDAGNKFMKTYTKSRANSDERDGSKTPTQNPQSPPGGTLPPLQGNDKSGYFDGFMKQLNDKENIKIHHPVLKKNSIHYESKKKDKTIKNNKQNPPAFLPSLTEVKKNSDEKIEDSQNAIKLPAIQTPTQLNEEKDFLNENQIFGQSRSLQKFDDNINNEEEFDKNNFNSKSLHALGTTTNNYIVPEDGIVTTRSTPGSWGRARYNSDANVYTPITRSGYANNNNYFINVFESFQI
jgi:hypothetical protein